MENIDLKYNPIQPANIILGDYFFYEEFKPCRALQTYIYCYWSLKSKKVIDTKINYQVAADGCYDIFFDLNDTRNSFFMGFNSEFRYFDIDKPFDYFGIRLMPHTLSTMSNDNASSFTNKIELLDSIIPALNRYLHNYIYNGLTSFEIKSMLDYFFIENFKEKLTQIDKRVIETIDAIFKHKGNLRIQKELEASVSQRQLRRLINKHIGCSLKTFCRIVRFQNFLSETKVGNHFINNQSYYNLNYYDQAHFIKDFKEFYGSSPKVLYKP